ncbi:hypothetical protein ACS0TY_007124 [Phlomoides rotata]
MHSRNAELQHSGLCLRAAAEGAPADGRVLVREGGITGERGGADVLDGDECDHGNDVGRHGEGG